MELTTDVLLRGTAWNKAITELAPIFKNRTNYSLYILAMTVGIMYDRRIEKPDEDSEETKFVPRNVLRKEDRSLEDETISIVFFGDEGLSRSQQMFTDRFHVGQ